MNIRKIIKEELLKEIAAGYDDPSIMGQHAGQTIGIMSNAYAEFTNVISGLANALADNQPKEDILIYLEEFLSEMLEFTNQLKLSIEDFTEIKVVNETEKLITLLKRTENKVRVLINMPLDMGDDTIFNDKVKLMVMDLIPSLQKWVNELNQTNKMFMGRLSGRSRGAFGAGFDMF